MFCDYFKMRKTQQKLTSQEISDLSGIPIATINNILCGRTTNPGVDVAATLIQVVGGSLDEACDLQNDRPKPPPSECDDCRLLKLHKERNKQKDKVLLALAACCAFLLLVFVIILLYDIFHPETGYIRM